MYSIKKKLDKNWELFIAENFYCRDFADNITEKSELVRRGIKSIPATVPGNFELDMQRAGLIDDPFFGENPLKIQELENRHLWYALSFDFSADSTDRTFLEFEGIDTFADIYLNGSLLGSTDNMMLAYEFNVQNLKKHDNELLVHIKPTVIEARKFDYELDVVAHNYYNIGSLAVRKAAHSFGWDICPRFISGGIWRDCFIGVKKKEYIEDIFLTTVEISENKAVIAYKYSTVLDGDFSTEYSLKIDGVCGEHGFSVCLDKLWNNNGMSEFTVENPALWWVRDLGEQNLYKVTATLCHGDEIVDTLEYDYGIRTIKIDKTETTDRFGNGEFCFYVNGERVYIRGTNWVPLDAFHSRDSERLGKALEMLLDVNCNAVRCWGGNVYETHKFFDFCDKHGILVWQDFAMACATYPQNSEFLARIGEEVEKTVKDLRRHTSIALWAGDNECDAAAAVWRGTRKDPNKNKVTREIIPEILERCDPFREYLPSSPYYAVNGNELLPEDHLWGPRDYFKGDYYTDAVAHFASEIGYHGCPSPESLKKFISKENLWPWYDNNEWLIHSTVMELGESINSYRNPLMANQIKVLFGEEPQDLETFSLASQLSQAEAMKFFVENFRSQKWRRTGVIWWNLVDCWPQISDAVVDYYYDKKIAYEFIKRSQEPLAIIMREPKDGFLTLVASNEFSEEKQVKFKVTDIEDNTLLFEDCVKVAANGNTPLRKIAFNSSETHFYLFEWEYDGRKYKNHYVSGKAPYDFKTYLSRLKEAEII